MPLMFQPLAKFADFEGRARRSEYWLFALFQFLLGCVFWLIIGVIAAASSQGQGEAPSPAGGASVGIIAVIFVLLWVALIIPTLAVAVRRMHDIDKSGAWILISLVPLVGPIVFLVFTLLDGTMGPNRYGPDPKNRAPYVPPGPTVTEVHHYHHGAPPAGAVPEGPGETS